MGVVFGGVSRYTGECAANGGFDCGLSPIDEQMENLAKRVYGFPVEALEGGIGRWSDAVKGSHTFLLRDTAFPILCLFPFGFLFRHTVIPIIALTQAVLRTARREWC